MSKLDVKEARFVAGLLRGLTKKEAAISAGFAAAGASQHATRLLERPSVQEALAEFTQRHVSAAAIDHERVRQKMLSMALADPSALYGEDWKLLPKSQVPPDVQSLVVSARSWNGSEGSGSAVKLVSQLEALRAYAKAYPPAPTQAESLEGACESADAKLQELLDRMEDEEEAGKEEEQS